MIVTESDPSTWVGLPKNHYARTYLKRYRLSLPGLGTLLGVLLLIPALTVPTAIGVLCFVLVFVLPCVGVFIAAHLSDLADNLDHKARLLRDAHRRKLEMEHHHRDEIKRQELLWKLDPGRNTKEWVWN